MKATIIKLPARYAIQIGEGDDAITKFGNTGYQSAEIAAANGATDIETGGLECLKITHTSELEQPSSSGSSPKPSDKNTGRSRTS